MKKYQTTYTGKYCQITVSEEIKDHISIQDFGEPCSGILRHWGTKKELIKELQNIIKEIEELNSH